jgi:hypothetical protein
MYVEGLITMVDIQMADQLRYVPNITSAGAVVLAANCAKRSVVPVRDFLHRYLGREHIFSASTVSSFT